jgi:hypothetical protein
MRGRGPKALEVISSHPGIVRHGCPVRPGALCPHARVRSTRPGQGNYSWGSRCDPNIGSSSPPFSPSPSSSRCSLEFVLWCSALLVSFAIRCSLLELNCGPCCPWSYPCGCWSSSQSYIRSLDTFALFQGWYAALGCTLTPT